MKYKCIIFDCDGVLVDSERITSQIIVDLANDLGANIDFEYAVNRYTGTSLEFVMSDIESRTEQKVTEDFKKQYRSKSYEAFKNELQPIEGIRELLEKLNIPICVASNGPLDKMMLNLKVTKLIDYFNENLFSAYEIGFWKPDPTLFLHAAENMGFQPHECVVIEDSISGIKAAKTGGFDVYGFAQKNHEKAFENEGAIVFSKMSDLPNLLR
jgi:HAD superfamily hydrolase (TIGR01509 family)